LKQFVSRSVEKNIWNLSKQQKEYKKNSANQKGLLKVNIQEVLREKMKKPIASILIQNTECQQNKKNPDETRISD
jgi:hypothetical protein